jgi:hypothetical protein
VTDPVVEALYMAQITPDHLFGEVRDPLGKASSDQQPALRLDNLQTCTLSPVLQEPSGQVTIHFISLGENALSNGNRQHRIMPDRVQKAVGLRAVDHAGPFNYHPR